MVEVEIEVPDQLFEEVIRLASENGWSLDETVTRALEAIIAKNAVG